LGEFVRDHYDSDLLVKALTRGVVIAYRQGFEDEARSLAIEARVWGWKDWAKTRRRLRGGQYWPKGIPDYGSVLPFAVSRRPSDLQLCLAGRAAFIAAEKGPQGKKSERYRCAINAYGKLLRQYPGSNYRGDAMHDLPEAYARTGQLAQALAALERLARWDPKHEAATAEGAIYHAAMLQARALAWRGVADTNTPVVLIAALFDATVEAGLGKEYSARAMYAKGRLFEKAGWLAQAEQVYLHVYRTWPSYSAAGDMLCRLGQCHYTRGRKLQKEAAAIAKRTGEEVSDEYKGHFGQAADHFAAVAEKHPEHKLAGKATVLAGQCWMRAEDYRRAIDVFRPFVEKTDTYDREPIAEALYWMGDCYMKTDQVVRAYRTFKRLTWDYPASKWSKYAHWHPRGEDFARVEEE
ncbi:tol-pal system YbgF family protein, partial [Verrucomicrobiota bacterium]